jgi:hypothetical protein
MMLREAEYYNMVDGPLNYHESNGKHRATFNLFKTIFSQLAVSKNSLILWFQYAYQSTDHKIFNFLIPYVDIEDIRDDLRTFYVDNNYYNMPRLLKMMPNVGNGIIDNIMIHAILTNQYDTVKFILQSGRINQTSLSDYIYQASHSHNFPQILLLLRFVTTKIVLEWDKIILYLNCTYRDYDTKDEYEIRKMRYTLLDKYRVKFGGKSELYPKYQPKTEFRSDKRDNFIIRKSRYDPYYSDRKQRKNYSDKYDSDEYTY